MSAHSTLTDEELCQIANESEAAYNVSQKQSSVSNQPCSESTTEIVQYHLNADIVDIYRGDVVHGVGQSTSESATATAACDTNADKSYCDNVTCGADKCVGTTSCLTNSAYSSRYKSSICDNSDCGEENISDRRAAADSLSGGNHMVAEENLPSSNSGCLPNADKAVETYVDSSKSSRVGNDAKSEIMNDGEVGVDEKLTPESPVIDGQNSNEGHLGSSLAENAAKECLSKPSGPPVPDKKPQCLSFSPDVLLVAPTGKAANVLGRRTGVQAFTLHHVIFSYRAWRNSNHQSPVSWKFAAVRALVVDESSLVAVTTFNSLINLVMPSLQKVVLLGDVLQLPSIEPGTPPLLILPSGFSK